MVFRVRNISACMLIVLAVAWIPAKFAFAQSAPSDQADGSSLQDGSLDSSDNSPIQDASDEGTTDSFSIPTSEPTDQTDQLPSEIDPYASNLNESDIDVTADPENPGAFQQVQVTLDSDLIDLRRYNITWNVDGKTVQQGTGLETLSTETKNYGQPTIINVFIDLPSGNITKKITLLPEDISLLWEAVDSYVPPFYQGKKLPPREGLVKIVAIPNFLENGQTVDPGNMVYNWQRNGNVITDASAYGTQAIVIKNNNLRLNEDIQVDASTLDDSEEATGEVNLSFYDPKILFYEKDPTTNIVSPLATSEISLDAPSTSVVAEPYFFSVQNQDPNGLEFSWSINGNPVTLSDPNSKQYLELQNTGGTGNADLSLSISNPNSVFQAAENGLSILFGAK